MNTGEGLAVIGIFIGVGLTMNYHLLWFLIPIAALWQTTDNSITKESNKLIFKKRELEIKLLEKKLKFTKGDK